MFDLKQFKSLFYLLYQSFTGHRAALNQLDAAVGDGDHGDTMARGFRAAARAAENSDGDIAQLFTDVSNALAEQTGGAIGPLLAAFFGEGMLVFAEKQDVGLQDLTLFFRRGYEAIRAVGGAKPGDKTLLDALEPAAAALEAGSDLGVDLALDRAAQAAEAGVEVTRAMKAEEGRARFLGERSKGHPDPGAASFALIVRAFAVAARGELVEPPALAQDDAADKFQPSGKFINGPETMVAEDNLGLALAYPGLVRLTDAGVLVRATPKPMGKVGLAIGQGGGFVGCGRLRSAVHLRLGAQDRGRDRPGGPRRRCGALGLQPCRGCLERPPGTASGGSGWA
jgi:dihydroxyacetone kinase phosphoprotein-dependent L subunit